MTTKPLSLPAGGAGGTPPAAAIVTAEGGAPATVLPITAEEFNGLISYGVDKELMLFRLNNNVSQMQDVSLKETRQAEVKAAVTDDAIRAVAANLKIAVVMKYEYIPDGMAPIKAKIDATKATKGNWPVNHIINLNEAKYSTLYITSDIHSDVRKFLQLLLKEGFITINSTADFDPYGGGAAPYDVNQDNIYKPEVINNITWIKDNTLLVLVGDIVDGSRGVVNGVIMDVNDPKGVFDLLLHVLLFNLRVSARRKNSDVLFTIGNHDYATVMRSSGESMKKHIHANAQTFFRSKFPDSGEYFTRRSEALRPFYDHSPYLLLRLNNGDKTEIACVHAGFHKIESVGGPVLSDIIQLEAIQGVIDESKTASSIYYPDGGKKTENPIHKLLGGGRQEDIHDDKYLLAGPLWTRMYANDDRLIDPKTSTEFSDPICKAIQATNIDMIVVGHCPTTETTSKRIDAVKTAGGKTYEGCASNYSSTNKGCVVADCDLAGHGPYLAFVDVGPSEMWRPGANKDRNAEFLKFTKGEVAGARYYGLIERKPAGSLPIPVWAQVGGKGPGAGGAKPGAAKPGAAKPGAGGTLQTIEAVLLNTSTINPPPVRPLLFHIVKYMEQALLLNLNGQLSNNYTTTNINIDLATGVLSTIAQNPSAAIASKSIKANESELNATFEPLLTKIYPTTSTILPHEKTAVTSMTTLLSNLSKSTLADKYIEASTIVRTLDSGPVTTGGYRRRSRSRSRSKRKSPKRSGSSTPRNRFANRNSC